MNLKLGDGATKLFLNTAGILDDVSEELKVFLDYLNEGKAQDDYTEWLEEEVQIAKQNREWRREYMTLQMRDLENIERGKEEGLRQGMEKAEQARTCLMQRLLAENRYHDLQRAVSDKNYREALYKEYNIK